MIKEIIETKSGDADIEGAVYNINSIQLENWLSDFGDPAKVINFLTKNNIDVVAILKSVYVPEKERNKGIGNQLMELFFNEIDDAEVVILELSEEDNDFSLEEWYEGFGFKKLKIEKFEDIMILILD